MRTVTDSLAYDDGQDPTLESARGGSHGAGRRFDTSVSDSITTSPEEQRRRIKAIACGFRNDEPGARDFLTDDSAKVRAAALGALGRMQRATVEDIASALGDRAPEVRRIACELSTIFSTVNRIGLLEDVDVRVVEACAFALGECEDHESTPALMRVARDHADPLCREAAVAALGAIGDDLSRTTLIEALGDIAQIRRRALIALSSFEGDDVELAMQGCLTDRDWQVRQAAEDLLGINAAGQQ